MNVLSTHATRKAYMKRWVSQLPLMRRKLACMKMMTTARRNDPVTGADGHLPLASYDGHGHESITIRA